MSLKRSGANSSFLVFGVNFSVCFGGDLVLMLDSVWH